MTKKEAIARLREYRATRTDTPWIDLARNSHKYRTNKFVIDSWIQSLIKQLIEQIQNAPDGKDPVDVIRDYGCMMDDVLCQSTNSKYTWPFASVMGNETEEILRYFDYCDRKEKKNGR